NPEASADLDGHVPGGITDISSEALSGCGILTAWCGGDAVADAHRRCPKCATQIQNLAQQSAQQQSLKSKALKFLGQHRTAVKVVSNTIVVVTAISGAFDVGASEAAVPEEVAGEAALDTAIDAEGEGADAATSLEQKVSDAQDAYPNKAGRIENHHIAPKYLGGDPNGPTAPLDGAYHQMITNAFRNEVPYGSGPVSPEELQQIMNKVYSQFPLPPGSN
ncbi:MAG: hypothetical protein ACRD4R_07350, partial [Candidatus Acidiferrales bacterium]